MDTSDQQRLNHTWNSSCKGVFNFPALAVQEKSNFLIVLLTALLLTVFQTVPSTWNIHTLVEGRKLGGMLSKVIHGFCNNHLIGILQKGLKLLVDAYMR